MCLTQIFNIQIFIFIERINNPVDETSNLTTIMYV
jgi:hypothetical protein